MRLEKIVLDGFKSFADKTEFLFDSPVTGIVGPNGCGKSNVVDAVKWVLGEQRVKSLRSDQMADVIFSGSSSRKGQGTAEVSLFISNPGGEGMRKLPIETAEVQISRRIYKSGESEYRINNKVCRLKDVRELFMDTGVGVRAYSIIEQGQVEQLLTSSKTDRRAIFEEAAGISKYKAHKKEALRKLERTEQNLLRLADILGEVQKQLRSVKLQAGKARNYLRYRDRLKDLQANYSLAEYAKYYQKSAEKRSEIERLQEEFARIAAEVARNDSLLSSLGEERIETEAEVNQTDNSLVSVRSKIEQELQRIEFLRSRIDESEERKDSARQRLSELHEQKKGLEDELIRYRYERGQSETKLEEQRRGMEGIRRVIDEINAECSSLAASLEDEKSGIIDIVRRTAQLHNEVQSISVYRNNLSSQKERLSGRADRARAELESLLAEKAQHHARSDDINKVLEELQEKLESKRRELEDLRSSTAEENERLSRRKETLSALSSESAVLSDMEARCEGLNAGVKKILDDHLAEDGKLDYVEGILADIISAEADYADAVEAALEGRTDSVVVNSTSRLIADGKRIKKLQGRVNFLCADKTGPFVDRCDLSQVSGVRGRLVEFVRTEGKYSPLAWKLLGKTLVVDSVGTASELAGRLGGEYAFVTQKGEFFSGDGTVKLGPLRKATGLISRKSRLRELQETIEKMTGEIEEIERRLASNRQLDEHLSQLCRELRTAVYEANTQKTEVTSKLSGIEENIKRLQDEQPLIASDIGLLEEQIAQSVQTEYDSKQKLEELEAVNSERTAQIEKLEARHAERKAGQEELSGELTELKVEIGQIAERQQALRQTIASLEAQIQASATATAAAQTEIENCSNQISEWQRDILSSEAKVSELYVAKEEKQQSSGRLHKAIEELLAKQKEAEQLIRQKRAEKEDVEHKINEIKIELSQLEVKNQDLSERVQEELQIDLAQAYREYNEQEVDWEKVREEMVDLRAKIERLGNVNLDAIDSQEELEKRNEFLSSQVEDLNTSRSQLLQLINRLNHKSREKFQETFEEIREHFQQIFRKLFGGGKADVILEDAEDILEAGIEIMARPPGKETRSISLLSGGEKSMTAIAMLFAVFKAKPSPFCFLDEVDAALDEANNERFNLLIKEFQKDSQFIIITHAKRTMSMADLLYGITMQTRGVSKKISVRFDQYEPESEPQAETAAVA